MPDTNLETDPEIIKDFFDEFDEMYEMVVKTIEKINLTREKPESSNIDSLFRGVHSIKSNLGMVGLQDLATIIHHLESILDQIRNNVQPYLFEYGDIIRFLLEETRISSRKAFNKEPPAHDLICIAGAIEYICNAKTQEDRQAAIDVALGLLDPITQLTKSNTAPQTKPRMKLTAPNPVAKTGNNYPHIEKDLKFFEKISEVIDERMHAYRNRVELVKSITLRMNLLAKKSIAEEQLTAAAYLSNWGLAVMPLKTIDHETLSDQEKILLKQHPIVSRDFLKALPYWKEAGTIVHQCHERIDGKGYPQGLKGPEICDGAKMLAISLTFAAILHSRPYQHLSTRTIMAAILEINKETESQFDEYWVDVFNQSIKQLHQEHKIA